MEVFHMTDILSMLNLPYPPDGRSSYYIQCPCCDESPRKRHLNINLKKDVFRCPRCGVSGGIFDLYSLYTGTPRDEVRDKLVSHIGITGALARPKKQIQKEEKQSCPLTDVESRHATYTAMLQKLSLAQSSSISALLVCSRTLLSVYRLRPDNSCHKSH